MLLGLHTCGVHRGQPLLSSSSLRTPTFSPVGSLDDTLSGVQGMNFSARALSQRVVGGDTRAYLPGCYALVCFNNLSINLHCCYAVLTCPR